MCLTGGQLGVGLDLHLGFRVADKVGVQMRMRIQGPESKQSSQSIQSVQAMYPEEGFRYGVEENPQRRPRGAAPWSFRSEWRQTQVDGRLLTGHELSSARKAEMGDGQGLLGDL